MMKDFSHDINVQPKTKPGSALLPLGIRLTARFESGKGSLNEWGLAVNGHQQSRANRSNLRHILRAPTRAEVNGDHFGVAWDDHDTLRIWNDDCSWLLTQKAARAVAEEIDLIIGGWAESMRSPEAAAAHRDEAPHAGIAALEQESATLKERIIELETLLQCKTGATPIKLPEPIMQPAPVIAPDQDERRITIAAQQRRISELEQQVHARDELIALLRQM
jgi:hypothetical protein